MVSAVVTVPHYTYCKCVIVPLPVPQSDSLLEMMEINDDVSPYPRTFKFIYFDF